MQLSNPVGIRPVGAQLFRADGQIDRQTDVTKLVAALRNSVDAPKNFILSTHCIIVFRMTLTTNTDYF